MEHASSCAAKREMPSNCATSGGRLKRVFELAGPFEEKPTPHRFRHTFTRILLEFGIEDTDVAELLGDTLKMVRRYYSNWIKTRQVRLSRILQAAFEGMPTRQVVEIH
jgi:integrase